MFGFKDYRVGSVGAAYVQISWAEGQVCLQNICSGIKIVCLFVFCGGNDCTLRLEVIE